MHFDERMGLPEVLLVFSILGLFVAFLVEQFRVEVVVLFTGLAALGATLASIRNGRIATRKQHTMNVLVQSRFSDVMRHHVDQMLEHFPIGTDIKEADLDDPNKKDALESVRFISNFYEFIAVSLKHGDLDEPLVKDCIRAQVCSFVDKTSAYILRQVQRDPVGPEKSKRYIELRNLRKRWDDRAK